MVQLPAKSLTLEMIWKACQEVAAEEKITLGKVQQVTPEGGDTTIKEINVCPYVDCSKAERIGMPMNVDLKDIIRDYVNTYIRK